MCFLRHNWPADQCIRHNVRHVSSESHVPVTKICLICVNGFSLECDCMIFRNTTDSKKGAMVKMGVSKKSI